MPETHAAPSQHTIKTFPPILSHFWEIPHTAGPIQRALFMVLTPGIVPVSRGRRGPSPPAGRALPVDLVAESPNRPRRAAAGPDTLPARAPRPRSVYVCPAALSRNTHADKRTSTPFRSRPGPFCAWMEPSFEPGEATGLCDGRTTRGRMWPVLPGAPRWVGSWVRLQTTACCRGYRKSRRRPRGGNIWAEIRVQAGYGIIPWGYWWGSAGGPGELGEKGKDSEIKQRSPHDTRSPRSFWGQETSDSLLSSPPPILSTFCTHRFYVEGFWKYFW